MIKDLFPPRPKLRPAIYAYEDTNPQYANLLKVGYTTVDAQSRQRATRFRSYDQPGGPLRISIADAPTAGDRPARR